MFPNITYISVRYELHHFLHLRCELTKWFKFLNGPAKYLLNVIQLYGNPPKLKLG
jgi:hypothetical protein